MEWLRLSYAPVSVLSVWAGRSSLVEVYWIAPLEFPLRHLAFYLDPSSPRRTHSLTSSLARIPSWAANPIQRKLNLNVWGHTT